MPFLMKEAGYRTGIIGKFHVSPPSAFAWDKLGESGGRAVSQMAKDAAGFIESSKGKPWYLHVGFSDPHRAAKGFANEKPYPGVVKNTFDPRNLQVPSFLPETPETRAELAQYYEAANRMDQGVGMMLDLLKSTGQLDNTLVIFLSDNGIPFPNAKTNLYDAGARLPLLVRARTNSVAVSSTTPWSAGPICADRARLGKCAQTQLPDARTQFPAGSRTGEPARLG